MTQIIRAPEVDAPTPPGRRGELLDVATIEYGIDWLLPDDMFTSWNCLDAETIADICAPVQKVFTSPTLVDGIRFAVYLGGECKPLIETKNVEANIDRVFDLRESRGVEKVFEQLVLGNGTLVPGTPVSAAHALGIMENALGDHYAGLGIIHVAPLIATLLLQSQLIDQIDGNYYTRLGTRVVVGTGYTSANMYGTGEITVHKSDKILTPAPDTAQNVAAVLAERAYVLVADCVTLKLTGIPMPQANAVTGLDLITGTATVNGPGDAWVPPNVGTLRAVTVVVTSGSVEVDGTEVTAPHELTFDADSGETLTAPVVTAGSAGDRAVIAWVIAV